MVFTCFFDNAPRSCLQVVNISIRRYYLLVGGEHRLITAKSDAYVYRRWLSSGMLSIVVWYILINV
jgi:hypothetical protein